MLTTHKIIGRERVWTVLERELMVALAGGGVGIPGIAGPRGIWDVSPRKGIGNLIIAGAP